MTFHVPNWVVFLLIAATAVIVLRAAFGTVGWLGMVALAAGAAGWLVTGWVFGSLFGLHGWPQTTLQVVVAAACLVAPYGLWFELFKAPARPGPHERASVPE